MLGLLFIYLLGKYFYKLAEDFEKHKWGYTILGVAAYYLGTMIGGVVIALVYELLLNTSIDTVSDTLIGVMALPFGILLSYIAYRILKKKFEKEKSEIDDDIEFIGVDEDVINESEKIK